MKTTILTTLLVAGLIAMPADLLAGQRPRNPGGSSGGGGGRSGGSSGGSTGSVGVPRGGGGSTWGGGSVASRPSEPASSPSSGRRPARVSGGGPGGSTTIPPYSRPRGNAPVAGYAVPRGSIATLPPIISGPVYWGPDNWYFYPWGFGGLGMGYFWDPWMWSGYLGGYSGYPWVDPYGWGGGMGPGAWGGGGGGGYGAWDGGSGVSGTRSADDQDRPNPLDPNAPTGGLRLKVEPRDAEVFVDGFYAGRVDDFDGAMQRLKIAHGPHTIELRAAGYKTATFDVTIIEGQTTTYRTSLERQ